jgi:hypothetical protein
MTWILIVTLNSKIIEAAKNLDFWSYIKATSWCFLQGIGIGAGECGGGDGGVLHLTHTSTVQLQCYSWETFFKMRNLNWRIVCSLSVNFYLVLLSTKNVHLEDPRNVCILKGGMCHTSTALYYHGASKIVSTTPGSLLEIFQISYGLN